MTVLVGTTLRTILDTVIQGKHRRGSGRIPLAKHMDKWGIAGCEAHRQYIIDTVADNTEMLKMAISRSPECQYAIGWQDDGLWPKAVLDAGAGWFLTEAVRVSEVSQRKAREPRPERKVTARVRTAGRTAGRTAVRTRNQFGGISAMRMTPIQKKLYEETMSADPPVPDPFTAEPVIHFCAHLWPVRGAWDWHAERWSELAAMIPGRKVIGVVTDRTTDTLQQVKEKLHGDFEFFEAENTKHGENPTFQKLQTMMPNGQDDIILYAHGKGVRPHTSSSEAVRIWSEMMYETVLFNHEAIRTRLAAGYKSFGSFRTFGDIPLSPKERWHYSGTFFAIRGKSFNAGEVKTGYGGVEAWPGSHIKREEAWNEFSENSSFKQMYDINSIYPGFVDAQMQWEVDRIGGKRCEQHKRELDWFLAMLKPEWRVLVIGSRNGGLEEQIRKAHLSNETVSIDIAPQPDNTENLIVGSSANAAVQEEARRRGPYDCVFIDGDHEYAGVKVDWLFAQTLGAKLIAFHDIAEAIKHRNEKCKVDLLWNEIKAIHKTEEKIVGCGWGGIGVFTP